MLKLTDEEFRAVVVAAIDAIPEKYQARLGNVAFIVEDEPDELQRQQLKLYPNETLFGLYEGLPLPQRNGTEKMLPDKITLFKGPLETVSRDSRDLAERVKHTIWHEVAHYFGLDHERIHELEQ